MIRQDMPLRSRTRRIQELVLIRQLTVYPTSSASPLGYRDRKLHSRLVMREIILQLPNDPTENSLGRYLAPTVLQDFLWQLHVPLFAP
jgi:hypothetical protein